MHDERGLKHDMSSAVAVDEVDTTSRLLTEVADQSAIQEQTLLRPCLG